MTPLSGKKHSTLPHIDLKPLVALHYKGSQVLKSFSMLSLDGWDDFGLQHNLDQDQDVVSENDFSTLEALLRPALRKQVSKATKYTL
jgi:hypothetical protein